jgi:putative PIN family toxin of toxin-antitoxin system
VRVVVDTNVIVSALINPYGVPAYILGLILEEKIELCYDSRNLIEYEQVLKREKFGFSDIEVKSLIDFLKETGNTVIAVKCDITTKDPGDLPFLEVASISNADFLITGNISHFPKKTGSTKVVTPSEFLSINFKL